MDLISSLGSLRPDIWQSVECFTMHRLFCCRDTYYAKLGERIKEGKEKKEKIVSKTGQRHKTCVILGKSLKKIEWGSFASPFPHLCSPGEKTILKVRGMRIIKINQYPGLARQSLRFPISGRISNSELGIIYQISGQF